MIRVGKLKENNNYNQNGITNETSNDTNVLKYKVLIFFFLVNHIYYVQTHEGMNKSHFVLVT